MDIPGIIAIRDKEHMWPASANAYLFPDSRGATLLDIGGGQSARYSRLKEHLSTAGLAPDDIHTVVLSHAHPDHMGAMALLLSDADPRIIIHEIEKPLAKEPQKLNETFDTDLTSKYYRKELKRLWRVEKLDIIEYFRVTCPMASLEATEVVAEGADIQMGRFGFEIIHTPGHAPGHISLYDESTSLMFTGDLVGAVVAWYCPSGGGAAGYLSSLKKIERRNPGVIMPSHGDYITDVAGAIASVREKILSREKLILDLLSREPRSVLELNEALFKNELVRLFPGIQITESHILKLEEEGQIFRYLRNDVHFVRLA